MVIGLTGGLGCGKSAAAVVFARLGFRVVNADLLAREVLQRPATVALLQARWGAACLGPDHLPHRAWIAQKVFTAPAELAFLESILHPEVARLRLAAATDQTRHHVVEIPLLFEKGLEVDYDCIVCIACSDEVCLARLAARGLTREESQARMNAQMTLGQKVAKSDYVLWNDGSRAFLESQVRRLVKQLSE